MTPTHTIAVWIGAMDHRTLGSGEFGGRAALPAWLQIVEALEADGAPKRFAVPPSVLLVPRGGRLIALPRGSQAPPPGDADVELPEFPGPPRD